MEERMGLKYQLPALALAIALTTIAVALLNADKIGSGLILGVVTWTGGCPTRNRHLGVRVRRTAIVHAAAGDRTRCLRRQAMGCSSFAQKVTEDGCLAVLDVSGGRQQRDGPCASQFTEPVEGGYRSGVAEFDLVAVPELGEPLRSVPVPMAQRCGRRDVFHPLVEMDRGLGQAARPYPVDKHPDAVIG
jgi:hypothetical protein